MDDCKEKETIISFLRDIHYEIPVNVSFIISTNDKKMNSDEVMSMLPFDQFQTRIFVRSNFKNIDEETVLKIHKKTSGYPAALVWLWKKFKNNQDMEALLETLPREGFFENLQQQIFDELDTEEINVLKLSSLNNLINFQLVKEKTGIDEIESIKILKKFENLGIMMLLNSVTAYDGRIVDQYAVSPMFSNLIAKIYGSQKDERTKLINQYANNIINDFTLASALKINEMISHYEASFRQLDSISTAENFLNMLDVDKDGKILIWWLSVVHLLDSGKVDKSEILFNTRQSLKIDNQDEKIFIVAEILYHHIIFITNLTSIPQDEHNSELTKLQNKINEAEDILKNKKSDRLTTIFSSAILFHKTLIQNLLSGKFASFEEAYLDALQIAAEYERKNMLSPKLQNMGMYDHIKTTSEKVKKYFTVSGLASMLNQQKNYHEALNQYINISNILESFTEEEEEELIELQYKSTGIKQTVNAIRSSLAFTIGVICISQITQKLLPSVQENMGMEMSKLSKEQIEKMKSIFNESTEYADIAIKALEQFKSDEIKKQYYEMAQMLKTGIEADLSNMFDYQKE